MQGNLILYIVWDILSEFLHIFKILKIFSNQFSDRTFKPQKTANYLQQKIKETE